MDTDSQHRARRVDADVRRSGGPWAWLKRLAGLGLPEGNVLLCVADEVLGVESGIEALELLAELEPEVIHVRDELPDMSVSAFLRQCEVLQPLALRTTLVDVADDGYDNCVTLDTGTTPALVEELRRLAMLTASMRALYVDTREELLERVDAEATLHSERCRLLRYLRSAYYQEEHQRDVYLATVLEYMGLHDDVQLSPRLVTCQLHALVNSAAAATDVPVDNLVGREVQVDVDVDLFEGALRGALGGLRELTDEYGLNALPAVRVQWRHGLMMEMPELQVPLTRLDALPEPFRLRDDGGPAGMQMAHAFYLAGCCGIDLDVQPGQRGRGLRLFWSMVDTPAV